jgi:hypothetical protein
MTKSKHTSSDPYLRNSRADLYEPSRRSGTFSRGMPSITEQREKDEASRVEKSSPSRINDFSRREANDISTIQGGLTPKLDFSNSIIVDDVGAKDVSPKPLVAFTYKPKRDKRVVERSDKYWDFSMAR